MRLPFVLVPLSAALFAFPAGLAAQRQLARPQSAQLPMQHDHVFRQRMVDGLNRSMTAHANLLRRVGADQQFGDQFEDAAARGDVNTVAQLFAQAAGVPVSEVMVERAPEVVGARADQPTFRFENAAVWTSSNRTMAKPVTMIKVCLFSMCLSLVSSRA